MSKLNLILYNKTFKLRNNFAKFWFLIAGHKVVHSLFTPDLNFGDQFNIDLLKHFSRQLTYVDDYRKSQVCLTGSILGNYQNETARLVATVYK